MAKKKFRHIVVMGRPGVRGVPETLQALVEYLEQCKVDVSIDQVSAATLKNPTIPIITTEAISSQTDLIIVVGGDGSLLNAAHFALENQIPVLGINRGRLGFLTDIHPDELSKVGDVLRGQYQLEKRFLLDAEIHYLDEIIEHNIALNDVVLLPGDLAQMIEFETFVNNQFVCSQRADGLIVSSPTGSTAYALSGGGPILHPKLDAVVLVPMFPHTLSSRPIVVDANSNIEIHVSSNNDTSPYVSCDGQKRVAIPPGGQLKIHKKQKLLQLIHPIDYNYFTTLREKLGWEKHAVRGND